VSHSLECNIVADVNIFPDFLIVSGIFYFNSRETRSWTCLLYRAHLIHFCDSTFSWSSVLFHLLTWCHFLAVSLLFCCSVSEWALWVKSRILSVILLLGSGINCLFLHRRSQEFQEIKSKQSHVFHNHDDRRTRVRTSKWFTRKTSAWSEISVSLSSLVPWREHR
jgi:hypothetical protein